MSESAKLLDERSKKVLWAVVESYIYNESPVGSRYICKKYNIGYSPATIRNIMADLEELGYLSQPHTSAGRVPTDLGYRFYVEQIMDEEISYHKSLSQLVRKRLRHLVKDMDSILEETTKTLSLLSHYMAMAASAGPEGTTLRRIELIPYDTDKIAVFILTNEGVIKHHVIRNEFSLSASDLRRISRLLNNEFVGYTIKEIKDILTKELLEDKREFDTRVERALKLCREVMKHYDSSVFVAGLSEILDLPEFADIKRVKELSRTIEDKHNILRLIERLLLSEGTQVIIGKEIPIKEMQSTSIILSTFKEKDRSLGVVGLIGPKRMNYHLAISLVDTAARFLTSIFNEEEIHDKKRKERG